MNSAIPPEIRVILEQIFAATQEVSVIGNQPTEKISWVARFAAKLEDRVLEGPKPSLWCAVVETRQPEALEQNLQLLAEKFPEKFLSVKSAKSVDNPEQKKQSFTISAKDELADYFVQFVKEQNRAVARG